MTEESSMVKADREAGAEIETPHGSSHTKFPPEPLR